MINIIKKIRSDFPILNKSFQFGNLVYLDSAATTQKPSLVIDGLTDFYKNHNSNIYRSVGNFAENATAMYELAREKVANFINADFDEIIFTSGATEGLNFVCDAWAKFNIKPGEQILLSQVEHHANLLPWQRISKLNNFEIKYLEIDKKSLKLKFDLNNQITNKTKLVSLTLSSNVLGEVWEQGQLEAIIKRAHEVGAKVLFDAAQAAPRFKIDVKKLNPDFLVFSGHKMLAPTGIGVLYIKKEIHEKVEPYKVGGGMVYSVAFDKKAIYRDCPYKFEAGTPAIAQAIGLGLAIDYLKNNIEFDQIQKYETYLTNLLIEGLLKIPEVKIWVNLDDIKKNGHLVTFSCKNIHAHDIATFLGKTGICVRAGNHCAQPLADLLEMGSTLRVSFYFYNTEQEVKFFLEELKKVIKYFTL